MSRGALPERKTRPGGRPSRVVPSRRRSLGSITSLSGLRHWGRRSLSRRNRAGAWLAILTCPCHGAFLLYLLAGTAFGSALFAYRGWMYAALGVAFATGLWVMCRPDESVCAISGPAPTPRGSSQSVSPPRGTPRG